MELPKVVTLSTPVELHIGGSLRLFSGSTPTLRFKQNATSGFGTAVWDVGGNESNLFIRKSDTGGVSGVIPFSVRSGAPANTLNVDVNGIGVNKANPQYPIEVGTGPANGNGARVTVGGVWTNGSSREHKTNIVPLTEEDAVTALEALQPVRYRAKGGIDPEEYVGFIAEDVPELVAMNDRRGVSSMDIAAVLTSVVQLQQQRIERLEAELDSLRQKLDQSGAEAARAR